MGTKSLYGEMQVSLRCIRCGIIATPFRQYHGSIYCKKCNTDAIQRHSDLERYLFLEALKSI